MTERLDHIRSVKCPNNECEHYDIVRTYKPLPIGPGLMLDGLVFCECGRPLSHQTVPLNAGVA